MPGIRAIRLRRPLAFAAFLVLAACGVGSSTTPIFVEGIIGPGGGTLEAQGVTVVIPPGAFDEEKVCAIVPGPDDLPVDPGAGPITLLPGCKCIGPRDEPLAVPGTMRLCYDVTDLPPKTSETDLVLLEWDESLGFLLVVPAVQDTGTHCFTDLSYAVLGYVTVGLRTGPPPPDFDFVLYGTTAAPVIAPQGLTQTGLFLADAEGLLAASALTGTAGAEDYLPSFDGSRILFTEADLQFDGRRLSTVDVSPPNDVREVLPVGTFQSSDPLFGWLGEEDRVFHTHSSGGSGAAIEPQGLPFQAHFSYKAGDGSGSVVDLRSRTGFIFLSDVRISPDRTMALLRWVEFGKGVFTSCDVIALDGTVLMSDVAGSFSDVKTPRWMPDSSGIYYVENDGVTVTEFALRPNDVNFPDGYEVLTLYTLNVVDAVLTDFVVAPAFPASAQRCAYVYRDVSVRGQVFGDGGGPDFFVTDTLAGDDPIPTGLGDLVLVDEMVPVFSVGAFQSPFVMVQMRIESQVISEQAAFPSSPDGHTLFFDLFGKGLVADLPVPIPYVDVSRDPATAGEVLVWIDQTYDGYPDFPTAGVYRLDASLAVVGDVTPPGVFVSAPPRWLRSWRHAPGVQPFATQVR